VAGCGGCGCGCGCGGCGCGCPQRHILLSSELGHVSAKEKGLRAQGRVELARAQPGAAAEMCVVPAIAAAAAAAAAADIILW
jgi:hypothetical protein